MDTPNYNYRSQVLGRRFVAQFAKGKAWERQVGVVQQGGITIDQRCAELKSNAARGPLEAMGFVGTTRPRDLLFCVDEWLEYRRRLSLVPIRSELKRRRTALSVHDEPGPASPNPLTFKQFRKIRTWKIGLLRHFRTGARSHN
jgi:hypothetical protein